MSLFELPAKSIINRVVPKNAFDNYTNKQQKKQMVDLIDRIRWVNKLSLRTINLSGKEITEIQIFEIELRQRETPSDLLKIFDRAIPYHVIFHLSFGSQSLISTSKKHQHPVDENAAVIDWTFSSDWFENNQNIYNLRLERSLDFIFFDICKQLSGHYNKAKSISELISFERNVGELKKAIVKLKTNIEKCKQFNKKVQLNIELHHKIGELESLLREKS